MLTKAYQQTKYKHVIFSFYVNIECLVKKKGGAGLFPLINLCYF